MEQLVGDRHRRRGRVALVAPGHRVEQRGGVAGVAGERPDLVERRGEGHDPVAADPAVGRLHPDDAGQRRRLADRAAGVGADAQRHVEGRHRRRRAAAAATGDSIEIPGIGRRPVGRVLGRRAHRELVHVGLAQDHRADVAQPLGDVGVVRGDVALEDARAGGALAALDRDQVLERDGDAQERMQRGQRGGALGPGGGQPCIGGVGLGQRPLVVDREPGVEGVVAALGRLERGFGRLVRAQLAAAQEGGQLVGQETSRVGHLGHPGVGPLDRSAAVTRRR